MPHTIEMSSPVFIIAEAGVNHNGEIKLAERLVDAALEAGADAVKFQTFQVQSLVTEAAPKAEYQQRTTSLDESQKEMLTRLCLTPGHHHHLLAYCQHRGIRFLSSPFDPDSLNFLVHDLGLTTVKLPSGAVTHGPLLWSAGRSGAKIILSTGMSTLHDVRDALGLLGLALVSKGNRPEITGGFGSLTSLPEIRYALFQNVMLMHCTSAYPTPFQEVNLRSMDTLATTFELKVGLSDHTSGMSVSLAAVARGASCIEKHLTLDRNLPGPDHQASLEPEAFKAMVQGIREVSLALGHGEKRPTVTELANAMVARSSLVALKPIAKGEVYTAENLGVKRPGTGISSMEYWQRLGRKATQDYPMDASIHDD